jgi:hypothetical protein
LGTLFNLGNNLSKRRRKDGQRANLGQMRCSFEGLRPRLDTAETDHEAYLRESELKEENDKKSEKE